MTKNQLDNLIGFCFNFHINMDSDILDHDYDYIMEKWEKYIGVKPSEIDSFELNLFKRRINGIDKMEIRKYNKDFKYPVNDWMGKWDCDAKYWKNIKEIFHFICVLNTRPLIQYRETKIKVAWSIEEIVCEFKKWIGDPESINTDVYKHLHYNIKSVMDKWLETNKREYKLMILDI